VRKVTLSDVIAVIALAMLQGALVALPRADALERLGRLRSPAWAAVLPGMIIVGALGLLALPSMAPGLILVASVATPLLAGLAVVLVARGQRAALLPVAVAVAVAAALGSGWFGQLSASTLTALGCLPLGAALVRLTPTRWVPVGVLTMCAVDAALLGLGIGQPASGLIADARAHVHGTVLDNAAIGSISTEYLDLLLAAVLGGIVAGHAIQRRAAVLVTTLAAGYGMLLPLVDPLPATVPVALAVILLRWGRLAQRWQTAADCTACRYAASERLSWCQPRNMVDDSRRTRTARP
jgi:hypothetical protein